MKTKIMLLTFFFLAIFSWVGSSLALEDLDELELRVSRKSTNTFYSGENANNYYIWQPQSVIYRDTSTNHEVMLWSQLKNAGTMGYGLYIGGEYGQQIFSADGKRIAFTQATDTSAYTRPGPTYSPWFVARTDGTYRRPVVESAQRTDGLRYYFDWSPTLPDVCYTVGLNNSGNRGLDQNGLYREVVSDTSLTSTLIVDVIPGNTTTSLAGEFKDNLTEDGLYYVIGSPGGIEPYNVIQVEPSGSRRLVLSYNHPTLDTTWMDTKNPNHGHDESLVGNASEGYWMYWMPSGSSVWWRWKLWGTDGNAPNHTADTTSPYAWWTGTDDQREVQVTHDDNNMSETIPDFMRTAGANYGMLYHTLFDRWGTHAVGCYYDRYPVVRNLHIRDLDHSWHQNGEARTPDGCQYPFWTGWTDYMGAVSGSSTTTLYITPYNSTGGYATAIAKVHSSITGDYTNPSQSPDGTKVAVISNWLNSTKNLFIVTAYYPYPPEITSVGAMGGTVTVTFDWRDDQASPRTYTLRGWPNETENYPPPPREIEKFRLWRCQSNCTATTGTWTPLATTNHDIFNRYNFATGEWTGSTYWTINDNPGDGTWYYAVTSNEWSGLESRVLSNIYSITISGGSGNGIQPGGSGYSYPADPGDLNTPATSNFYTSYNPANDSKLIRYYNIYAKDGTQPAINQKNRIASVPVGHCSGGSCMWVDWLGNTNGTTQYVVTVVDTQGQESSALTVTRTPLATLGQYRLEWKNLSGNAPASPTGLRLLSQIMH